MPQSFRITKQRYAANAFDGNGAALAGGRWSSPGVRVVYSAGTIALAALEMLVHLEHTAPLAAYVIFTCTFDDSLVIDPSTLPNDWNRVPLTSDTQQIGNRWIHRASSAVLRVPSAVVAEESNYLLNPQHRDFHLIQISPPRPFLFDPRLISK